MKLFRKLAAAALAASLMITAGSQAFADYSYSYDNVWGVCMITDEDTGEQYYYDEESGNMYTCYEDDDGDLVYYDDVTQGRIPKPEEIIKEDPSTQDGIFVQLHTQEEIAKKYIELGLNTKWKTDYDSEPSTTKPYSEGKLTDKSLHQGLNMLNFVRYTAGLPDNVTLNDDYNHYAQCASVVNAANGSLSHSPSRPSGMSDALYEDGRSGAGKSNIGMGYSSLPDSIVRGYMEDSDASNINRVGHRRWLLNPSMKEAGFGFAGRYTATYVIEDDFDFGRSFAGDYVAWPPENMPMELYRTYSNYAFSVNVGNSYDKNSLYDAVVKVSSKKTGKSWTISYNSSKDTYFSVNNDNYGMSGCIIFDTGVLFESGDTVSVNISNIQKTNGEAASISYDVNFFTICPSISDCEISSIKPQIYTGKAIKPKPTVKYKGEKLTEGVDYTLTHSNNKRAGTATITIRGKGKYSGSTDIKFTIKPKKQTISKLTAGYGKFTVSWKKAPEVNYYMIQYSTSSSMKDAETVYSHGSNTSETVSGLKSGKKYYVRICNYVYDSRSSSGYITGAWSKVKTVKVK